MIVEFTTPEVFPWNKDDEGIELKVICRKKNRWRATSQYLHVVGATQEDLEVARTRCACHKWVSVDYKWVSMHRKRVSANHKCYAGGLEETLSGLIEGPACRKSTSAECRCRCK
ncbi:hypothetical protein HAX54_009359 [Datura stramonium]|uniref:Uncharacterized protein n=1 Tax=Datura stramonium TaxID=4076 RepID=A0ABS8TGD0_DATST|nr:hypothetical protein [Datura stramonium]